ncbi:MAG: serpin family protein [Clostridia bacterium]|nr:serpin family protein [Clostridia bacterium]
MRRDLEQAKAELERRYAASLAQKTRRSAAIRKAGTVCILLLSFTLLTVGVAIRTPEGQTTLPGIESSATDLENSKIPESSSEEPAETSRPVQMSSAKNLMAGITPMSVTKRKPDNAFITSQMDFAVKLLQQSLKKDGGKGALVSPLSAQLCLAMVANGADGETLAEMEKVLGGDLSLEQLNQYLSAYAESLPSTEKTKLLINNAIWFKEGYPIYTDFLQTNANYYGADLYQAPFGIDTLEADLREINDWVNTNTDGMIPKLFDELDEDTVMVLINTLLFDGTWETAYADKDVVNGTFYSYSGKEQTVEMMCSTESVYFADENAKGFLKYYDGKDYAFAAILPEQGTDILEYVNSLNGASLQSLLAKQYKTDVDVGLPKFKFEYSMDLKPILSDMGMPTAFLNAANFSKMSSRLLHIGQAVQKTAIELSPTGTKAAAATGVGMEEESISPAVILNRPFVYMILDTKTNLPLFIGVMTEMA